MSQFLDYADRPAECPEGPHRPPEGPNEDVASCLRCGMVSFSLRPEGETYGLHEVDCSLPERHYGRCQPGGVGHPPAKTIRGWWPDLETEVQKERERWGQ